MRLAAAGALATIAALGASCAEPTPPAPSIHGQGAKVVLDRPDTPGASLQFRFDDGDAVEAFASAGGAFVVHFTREGDHAVPDEDEDGSGIPDFVEEVAATYDEVLAAYEGLGFLAPLSDGDVDDNGGDDRFDVYLVDFAGVGDGTFRVDDCLPGAPDRCIGFMTQENDFVGYPYPSTRVANRILASHELFHAVQAAYDRDQGSVLAEGSAVWATEAFDPTLEDFEAFLPGYLENPDRPIDEPLPGPVDPFSYGSALFFQFLEEAYGPGIVRALWDACVDGAGGVDDPYWVDVLDGVLQTEADVPFADAFVEFARWNLHTDDFGDPETSYADGADYPRVKIEQEAPPFVDESLRVYYASASYIAVPPGARATMTAALVAPADDPTAADGLALMLAVESDGTVETTLVADPSAGTETVDVGGAGRLVVVVVNTETGGDSRKPGLCIGDGEEVASCIAVLSAGGGEGGGGSSADGATASAAGATTGATATAASATSSGAGGQGAGSGTGGAAGDDGDGATGASDDGCGCRTVGSSDAPAAAYLSIATLALAASRRRRRSTRANASTRA